MPVSRPAALAAATIALALLSLAGANVHGRETQPAAPVRFDAIVRNATIHDGTGGPAVRGAIAIRGDRIAAVGGLPPGASAALDVDAGGLAVAPGFINVLSWSVESLLVDGRSIGELRQGVTTQVFGEGSSMGPLNPDMKQRMVADQGDLRYDVTWTTRAEYLDTLQRRGVTQNVASFVGATTVREHVVGLGNRQPNAAEMERMRALVREAMDQGALGVGSSLIYAPASYSTTEELVELCKVASAAGGSYISHLRSEGNRLLEALDEFLRIAREAKIPAEIYHLKAAGRENWPKMTEVIQRIERARAEGLQITADMYTYAAGATGLDATLPPWALDGGFDELFRRLADPAVRPKILDAIRTPTRDWENFYVAAGAEGILLADFKNERLKPLAGRTLASVARERGTTPEATIADLMLEDRSRVGAVFFLMSEDNVARQLALPWVSFGSDAASMAAEGVFLKSSTHPRAYGNFARWLGKYVREQKVTPLPEAIRRLTSLPATNLGLRDRGVLKPGAFADLVVFDPDTIADRATYERPHQYSVGVTHVFVNGVQVLRDGEHTGAYSGRALKRGR